MWPHKLERYVKRRGRLELANEADMRDMFVCKGDEKIVIVALGESELAGGIRTLGSKGERHGDNLSLPAQKPNLPRKFRFTPCDRKQSSSLKNRKIEDIVLR